MVHHLDVFLGFGRLLVVVFSNANLRALGCVVEVKEHELLDH